MKYGMIAIIVSSLNMFLISITYFRKERMRNFDNSIFSKMLILNSIGLILEFSCFITVPLVDEYFWLNEIVNRLFLIYIVSWSFLLIIYEFKEMYSRNTKYIEFYNNNKNAIKLSLLSVFMITILLTSFSEIHFFNDDRFTYSYGMAVDIVFVPAMISFIAGTISIIYNRKTINYHKLIPFFSLFVILGIALVIRVINPGFLFITPILSFVTIIMYFTIENPDVKMLNEMYKNKELMEQGYEDKYNFLFEMTQEARRPLININGLSNALRMEDNPQRMKEGLLTLNNMVRQLDFSINNILNISSLDVSKIKIVNNKYELDKLCHELEVRIKPEIKPTVQFSISMPQQMPILLGDYMKIRQILYSLLINSCKNTENGSINMRVNLIEKYDVARIVFNISDTGPGMSIEKINEILSATGSLDQQEIENLEKKEFNVKLCQKVVKIMGGNLMIKSNVGEGTEIVLTIDQRVYHEQDNSILNQYENAIANYRKVLIVSQNKDKIGIIKKKLTDNHITYSSLYSGADAIDRIKAGKKFDFILVDDEMAVMSGFMTFKGMQKVSGFNTPVIVMLNENKENIKDHYLEDGFSDYLLLDKLETELDRIIEKY